VRSWDCWRAIRSERCVIAAEGLPASAVLAAGLGALAGWLLAPPPASSAALRSRLAVVGATSAPPRGSRRASAVLVPTAILVLLLVTASRPAPTVLPLAATAAVVLGVGVLLLRRSRARVRASARRAEVMEACDALAAGLRAGQPPHRALDRVAADVALLVPAATAARLGGDVPAALRASARVEGAETLTFVASAWTVAQRSGAGLADVASSIAGAVRSETEQRRQVEVALGTSRSTARLLAGLPLMGVALGTGIDADPLGVLFGSAVGAWILLAGVTLASAGVLWVERLAEGALR